MESSYWKERAAFYKSELIDARERLMKLEAEGDPEDSLLRHRLNLMTGTIVNLKVQVARLSDMLAEAKKRGSEERFEKQDNELREQRHRLSDAYEELSSLRMEIAELKQSRDAWREQFLRLQTEGSDDTELSAEARERLRNPWPGAADMRGTQAPDLEEAKKELTAVRAERDAAKKALAFTAAVNDKLRTEAREARERSERRSTELAKVLKIVSGQLKGEEA